MKGKMDWLNKLPPMAKQRAQYILGRRECALQQQQCGAMGLGEAKRIVKRETRTLERLAARHGVL